MAAVLGIPRETIARWEARGISNVRTNNAYVPPDRRTKLTDRAAGRTQAEVAAVLGIPRETIARWEARGISNVRTNNAYVPPGRRTKLTASDIDEIRRRVEAGESQAQVAAVLVDGGSRIPCPACKAPAKGAGGSRR